MKEQHEIGHGIRKRVGVHPPAALAEAIADRRSLWRPDYHPSGPAQDWAFDRLVAESVRLDFCEVRICAARFERAARASESWDDDQAAATLVLITWLAMSAVVWA
ncbi:hypothetical protein AB1L30_01580, partial [Bremerella sp. JC817]|uniref:hypothetical protein n=1 Tax=Bremerella sp. JC817 TaxID=3231756 RepID=UPI00345A5F6A